ncbi:leucine-rich repeat protein [Treponema parvum]|uniref:leucine-rich repeat protein n=1 Tax=Treponema parvum TaxID=138851 RepID=UPI001AEC4398|nr:leucine-rich repeat protein [Treponema parvum]QTQ16091.1 leucine-rich repeat protein [Treponema parvum]
MFAAILFTGLAISCSNGSGSGGTPEPEPPPTPPPVTKYKVTLEKNVGGNVAVSPALSENGMVAENTVLTFTAEPLSGYEIEKWTLNGTEVNGTELVYTLTVTQAAQVKVFFKENGGTPPAKHTVTLSAPVNGTVTSSPVIPSDNQVPENTEITFTATPNEGYAVDTWTVTPAGALQTGGSPGSAAATVKITENTTVTVTFKQVKFKIDFSVDGANGTLTAKVDGTEILTGKQVEHGKTVEFTATPAGANFAVDKWTNGGSNITEAGANETYNHTVTANANIKVKFKYAGADLTLDKRDVTKNKGETFLYRLVTAGSGSYTAVPEQAGIISLDTSDLNSHGNIKITFSKAGATRIKVTDTLSGQTDFLGTITVKPSAFIPDYFAEAGVRYHVTDKTALKVSVTAYTDSSNYAPYTGTSLAIPKEVIHDGETYTVTDIEDPYKWGDTLQSVTVAADNTYLSSVDGVIFNGDKSILRWYPKGKPGTDYEVPESVKTLATYAFRNVSALQTIRLPDGLKRIEEKAIFGCSNVQNLTLPDSLEYLGFYALGDMAITSLTVPQGITEISGIQNCSQLQTVDLPSQLTKFGWVCFYNCGALTTVTCRAATPPTIAAGQHVFEGTPIASATLKVPADTEGLYRTAEGWKDFGTFTAITP